MDLSRNSRATVVAERPPESVENEMSLGGNEGR